MPGRWRPASQRALRLSCGWREPVATPATTPSVYVSRRSNAARWPTLVWGQAEWIRGTAVLEGVAGRRRPQTACARRSRPAGSPAARNGRPVGQQRVRRGSQRSRGGSDHARAKFVADLTPTASSWIPHDSRRAYLNRCCRSLESAPNRPRNRVPALRRRGSAYSQTDRSRRPSPGSWVSRRAGSCQPRGQEP